MDFSRKNIKIGIASENWTEDLSAAGSLTGEWKEGFRPAGTIGA
jgi:hypothetical protein